MNEGEEKKRIETIFSKGKFKKKKASSSERQKMK